MDFTKIIRDSAKKAAEFSTENKAALSKEINIGFGVDAAFIRPMGVTITSLAVNNPDIFLNVYLFLGSSSEDGLAKLEQIPIKYPNVKLILYKVELETFKQLPVLQHISLAMYFRLIMPIALCGLNSVLYLDSDVICLNKIEELISADMEEKAAFVIADIRETKQNKRIADLNLPFMPLEKYFNSGVILINITKWNELKVSENTIKLLLEHPAQFHLPDQDALNIILNGQVKYLPQKWNFYDMPISYVPSDTIFLHFVGAIKPWSCACDNITQSYYLKYEALSPWQQTPLELPATYKHMKGYSKILFKKKNFLDAIKWYLKYMANKFL